MKAKIGFIQNLFNYNYLDLILKFNFDFFYDYFNYFFVKMNNHTNML
jgi:hypothetical protein